MEAGKVVERLRTTLTGMPLFLAGSLVAAEAHGLPFAYSDADLFAPSEHALIASTQKLLDQGYTLDDRFSRVYTRWLKYGMRGWHTNSIRLEAPWGGEVNLVFKTIQRSPTKTLSQVLESFDFGLLGVGYDLEYDQYRDLRGYMFPGLDLNGPLPLTPGKREDWINGFISQYNGLREAGRYAKYHGYGYDMSAVKDDLITGYLNAALYHESQDKPEKHQLAVIYETIAEHISQGMIAELAEASKEIVYLDSLDEIMEALE